MNYWTEFISIHIIPKHFSKAILLPFAFQRKLYTYYANVPT